MTIGGTSLAPLSNASLSNASFPANDTVSRSSDVKKFHSKSVDSIDSNLRLTSGDVGKAKLLSEIAKDGGKSVHDRLLQKLNQNATGPMRDPVGGHGHRANADQPDDSSKYTSVPVIIDSQRLMGPEDLIAGEFMRIGGSHNPDSLKIRTGRDNEVTFRMSHKGNTAAFADNDVGVTPCVVRRDWNEPANSDLAKARGVFHDESFDCSDITRSYGKLSIRVQTGGGPVEGTLFSLDETVDSRLYKSAGDHLSHLTPDASVATYEALKAEGVAWETESVPLIALRVMNHDGKNYLTLQAAAYYGMFNDGNKACMPAFAGAATPLNQATCCDGVQDGKYIAVMPLPGGWFDIKYAVGKGDFASSGAARKGDVTLWVNDGSKANTFELKGEAYGHVGNNNHFLFGGGKLQPKFGLFDVSADRLTAKFKSASFSDYADVSSKHGGPSDPRYQHVQGECGKQESRYNSKNPYSWLKNWEG
ncbi:hypothetical protein [Endozoicomonas sp. SCSIO W0465]|uniref:hypothetical protein n=1 Tax=Endozoicomonas sp. SCSIO W0465 TaxID=2918516 RepID=UPI0020765A0D|nr:hypothetical protein [Endozoicomonas sp. SCSIO W0465]USE34894.1 hypothetical protein MJO57_22605 [Endozoicomonas sp. SCSIO W0465]